MGGILPTIPIPEIWKSVGFVVSCIVIAAIAWYYQKRQRSGVG